MSTSTRRCLRGASPTKVNHFNPFSEQFQEFRSNPVYFGSVPVLHENCTDIDAGKRKWKDHKLGLASSWGKGCQDVFPLFYSTPSGTKNKSPELNKEGPVGLFNPPLAWREISEVFLSLFFSFFFFASSSNSIVCSILFLRGVIDSRERVERRICQSSIVLVGYLKTFCMLEIKQRTNIYQWVCKWF